MTYNKLYNTALDFKDLVEINLPSYIESYKDKYFDR